MSEPRAAGPVDPELRPTLSKLEGAGPLAQQLSRLMQSLTAEVASLVAEPGARRRATERMRQLRDALDAALEEEPSPVHPWQEYNPAGNTCHFRGCLLTEGEHPPPGADMARGATSAERIIR
jgi:hypothetical protein